MYLFFEDHLISMSFRLYGITSVHYGTEAQKIIILLTIQLQHTKNDLVQKTYKYILYEIDNQILPQSFSPSVPICPWCLQFFLTSTSPFISSSQLRSYTFLHSLLSIKLSLTSVQTLCLPPPIQSDTGDSSPLDNHGSDSSCPLTPTSSLYRHIPITFLPRHVTSHHYGINSFMYFLHISLGFPILHTEKAI